MTMATTAKLQREKSHGSNPRLMPRQTAASTARAARNATNRNLQGQPPQKLSPIGAISSSSVKGRPKSQKPSVKEEKTPSNDGEVLALDETVVDVHEAEPSHPPSEAGNERISQDDIEAAEAQDKINDIQNNSNFDIRPAEDEFLVTSRPSEDKSLNSGAESSVKSRPCTPARVSRPNTPNTPILNSRPSTPRRPSRPTTPASHSSQRTSIPSHPTTPAPSPAQRTSIPSRPNTPKTPVRPTTPSALPVPVKVQEPLREGSEDLNRLYKAKQKKFQEMKKELDLKQEAVLEVFEGLRSLRERMNREGVSGSGEGCPQQELVIFNVGDWTAHEVEQLCRETVDAVGNAEDIVNTAVLIDDFALEELNSKVLNFPTCFANLCLQAFNARQELIDWLKDNVDAKFVGQDTEDPLGRIAQYNNHGLELCEALRDVKARADSAVEAITQLSKRACRERGALINVGQTLVREVARLRRDMENNFNAKDKFIESKPTKEIEEFRRELLEERTQKSSLKDKLSNTENQLRQARNRISKMDRQLREAEASIASLTGTVKSLEDQSRLREVQLEQRARKLKESLKTGEVASTQLVQERDTLQGELQSLKEQIQTLIRQHKAATQASIDEMKGLKTKLEEQEALYQKEIELRTAAQKSLEESNAHIEELKSRITQLENILPNSELPTEREMDLWAELQATKDTLRITEDEVTICKREKVRFLETLTKIAESENKVGIQQKLAAELLSKEEIIGKMQMQIRELTKNIKLNEQKVVQYEQYVRDLQAYNRAVVNCPENPDGINYQDLQQEIMNLKMTILESSTRNEELTEILSHKDQQLEQQDKTSRAQARVIKVREELINMLKNKETEQSRELSALQQDLEHRMKIVEEVNKQIAAKAEEIQELFTTLESKQQQIHRLEKIVLALEEQQRRAQAQRTRHEEKIAMLEHELAAGGNRKERKFLFF